MIDLRDIESTARIVKNYQDEFDIERIFYDHSRFEWKFDYVSEYQLAKDFQKLLPYRDKTRIAFYLGNHYKEHYWDLMNKLISENSKIQIKYFASKKDAIN